jgi:hypothetical protein
VIGELTHLLGNSVIARGGAVYRTYGMRNEWMEAICSKLSIAMILNLLIGSLTVICEWTSLSKALVQDLVNPSLVDLLALARTMPSQEIIGTPLGRSIRGAVEKAERRIKKAAGNLVELEVTESEIRALVEARIATRLSI